jgi:hypothetical protein
MSPWLSNCPIPELWDMAMPARISGRDVIHTRDFHVMRVIPVSSIV